MAIMAIVGAGCDSDDGNSSAGTPATAPDGGGGGRTACAPLRAEAPGTLPDDGSPTVGDVQLPHGTRLTGSDQIWATDGAVTGGVDVWRRLVAAFPQTGLWPVILEPLMVDDSGRPWDSGELGPSSVADIDAFDAREVLASHWSSMVDIYGEDGMQPFGSTFPELATGTSSCTGSIDDFDPDTGSIRIGLVAVTRPADAVAAIGWSGPANEYQEIASISAVLRTWEDRFGAYVVVIGFDTLELAVERPDVAKDQRTALAAEWIAFDPTLVEFASPAEIANGVDASAWQFWWD